MRVGRKRGEKIAVGTGLGLLAASWVFISDQSSDYFSQKDISRCAGTLGFVAMQTSKLDDGCVVFKDMLDAGNGQYDVPSKNTLPAKVHAYEATMHDAAVAMEVIFFCGGVASGVVMGEFAAKRERRRQQEFDAALEAILKSGLDNGNAQQNFLAPEA